MFTKLEKTVPNSSASVFIAVDIFTLLHLNMVEVIPFESLVVAFQRRFDVPNTTFQIFSVKKGGLNPPILKYYFANKISAKGREQGQGITFKSATFFALLSSFLARLILFLVL